MINSTTIMKHYSWFSWTQLGASKVWMLRKFGFKDSQALTIYYHYVSVDYQVSQSSNNEKVDIFRDSQASQSNINKTLDLQSLTYLINHSCQLFLIFRDSQASHTFLIEKLLISQSLTCLDFNSPTNHYYWEIQVFQCLSCNWTFLILTSLTIYW